MDNVIDFKDFNLNEKKKENDGEITYMVKCKDNEGVIKELIEYIGANGNGGHSFEIVVDPDMTKEEGKKSFYWDGDGSDRIIEVKKIEEK